MKIHLLRLAANNLVALILVSALAFLMAGQVLAASTFSISPSSGNVHGTFSVNVVLTTDQTVNSIEFNYATTGPISYVGYATVSGGSFTSCSVTTSTKYVLCTTAVGSTYSGGAVTIIRLRFQTTGEGAATVSLSGAAVGISPSGSENGTTTGGSYTAVASSSSDTLPDTGLLSQPVLLLMLAALLITVGGYVRSSAMAGSGLFSFASAQVEKVRHRVESIPDAPKERLNRKRTRFEQQISAQLERSKRR